MLIYKSILCCNFNKIETLFFNCIYQQYVLTKQQQQNNMTATLKFTDGVRRSYGKMNYFELDELLNIGSPNEMDGIGECIDTRSSYYQNDITRETPNLQKHLVEIEIHNRNLWYNVVLYWGGETLTKGFPYHLKQKDIDHLMKYYQKEEQRKYVLEKKKAVKHMNKRIEITNILDKKTTFDCVCNIMAYL